VKYSFCTLFDSSYLSRGIVLYNSLELYCNDFHLYIFAFDDKSYEILKILDLRNATIISLNDFENEDLIRIKQTRTIAEYCWTCTASTIWYSIHKFNLDHCTYLDADMLFFASPNSIYEEIGNNSIGITSHNFSPKLKSSEVYGKYCVQFTYFKNDVDGLKALNWWKNSCIEWCYAEMKDGKYGDQKYLDYFLEKFHNVCVISNHGAGVAPWNISKFNIESTGNEILIGLKSKQNIKFQLIFYHYQGLKIKEDGNCIIVEPAVLKIPELGLQYIYKPYVNKLIKIEQQINKRFRTDEKIVFQRKLINSIGFFFRNKLKRYRLIQTVYFKLIRSKYNHID
jgi:hypothetical protein